jgi:hypothetical protein
LDGHFLDSRQLHIAARHLSATVSWDKDWLYFGTGLEMKKELIREIVNRFLPDDNLNLVDGRNNSGTHDRTAIEQQLEMLTGARNFQLWNESLNKVIEFNRIGVLRMGTIR